MNSIHYGDEIGEMMGLDVYDTSKYSIDDLLHLYRVHPKEVWHRILDVETGSIFIRDTEESGQMWNDRFAWAIDVIANAIAWYYAYPEERN